ncbi:MAG: hypothetical protein EZS28_042820, partial [Streblomastix strix]
VFLVMKIFFLALILVNNFAFCSIQKSNAVSADGAIIYKWDGSSWIDTTYPSSTDLYNLLNTEGIYRFYYTSGSSDEPYYTASSSSTLKNIEFSEIYSDVMEPEFQSSEKTRTSPFIVVGSGVTDFTMSNVILSGFNIYDQDNTYLNQPLIDLSGATSLATFTISKCEFKDIKLIGSIKYYPPQPPVDPVAVPSQLFNLLSGSLSIQHSYFHHIQISDSSLIEIGDGVSDINVERNRFEHIVLLNATDNIEESSSITTCSVFDIHLENLAGPITAVVPINFIDNIFGNITLKIMWTIEQALKYAKE